MFMGLGDFTFEIGDTIYQSISEQIDVRFAAQEYVAGATGQQLLGRGEQTKTLEGVFYPFEHGGLAALAAFEAQAGSFIPLMMVSWSGSVFGFWLVRSVSSSKSHLLAGNMPQKVEFTVELIKV
ncbi:MAG: phage tail protein [Rhizobiales bacterium]|nr:phage tail protein [Hyphomicrobiales bacterium]